MMARPEPQGLYAHKKRRGHQPSLTAAFGVFLLIVGMMVAVAPPASAAGCTGNAIVCENQLPGTPQSQWDVQGAGDDSIQGFATQISANIGDTVQFKIKTDASAYTVQIFRLGYYQGDGARKIADVTPSAHLPQSQPACATDPATEIYDCGTWGVSASWTVPATAVSGVYIARLFRADKNDSSQIPFIVRDDSSHSAIVYQTSDPTWEAYNTYGQSDFYQGLANGRAYKVSYNRPFADRGGTEARDFLFSNEYPMIRFLEQNGYDLSYISGLDTDVRGTMLTNHKTFLSVGHDEYWSAGQRTNVENARDAGVNLAFFSGNEVYWKTRWEPSEDGTTTANRTLVCYKDTWAGTQIDPVESTATWRDPTFGNNGHGPENALTGTAYMSNNTDLPITVSAQEGLDRLWRNTSLASLAPGTTAALAAHTVGYESDEDLDNGFRPAGLIRLSTTTGATPQYLRDFGNIVTPGTTTHHLTLYRASSGALVFGAGTIQWAWGLDTDHDGTVSPVDPRMQQATVNLMADMNASATTLMPGLVPASKSTDATAPTSTISSPTLGTAVAHGSLVTVTGTAGDTGGGVVAGVEVSLDGGVSWHPASGTTSYSYTGVVSGTGPSVIQVRAIDDSANIQASPTKLTTNVGCPCEIFGDVVPAVPAAADAASVTLGTKFTSSASGFITAIRFYKGAGNTGTHIGMLYNSNGTVLSTVTFTNETQTGWQTASFPSAVPITVGATYVAAYQAPNGDYAADAQYFAYGGHTAGPLNAPGGITSLNGVYGSGSAMPFLSFKNTNYYVDIVYSGTDTTPLSVTTMNPIDGSSSVPVTSALTATFSRDANPASISFTVTDPGQNPIAGTTTYDQAHRLATFTPAQPLAFGTKFTARVTASADGVGAMPSPPTWSFTTAQPDPIPGVCPCGMFKDTDVPSVLVAGDTNSVELGMAFSADTAGIVSGIRFYKSSANTGAHTISLWTSTGILLTSAPVSSESAAGWQTASFGTPVSVTAGTQYIASYHAPAGNYSYTSDALTQALDKTPLHTPANAGRYGYGSAPPTNAASASYFVDPVFTVGPGVAPTVAAVAPATGSTSVPVSTTTVMVNFDTSIQAGTASITLNDASGAPVSGALGNQPLGPTASFTPTAALSAGQTYTVTVTGAKNLGGTAMTAPFTSTFTTAGSSACPCSLLSSSASPTVSDSGEAGAISIGLQFTADVGGTITGLRFYRDAANTGSHTGTLYTASGTKLASLTFPTMNPGWQTASFSSPVSITAGTTYVASTFMPIGHYSATSGFFRTPVVNSPLTGIMGTYTYGSDTFPTSSFNNTNYFVDVSFLPAAKPGAPTAVSVTPGDSSASVTWTAPSDGGSPITAYTVTPYAGATAQTPTVISGSSPGTSATIGGLTNGTQYTFTVSATNAFGTGAPSSPSNPVSPAPLPGTPTDVSASSGDGSATVSWSAPIADGGSPITAYTITPFIGSTAQPATTITGSPPNVSATITGLTSATAYTFTVSATSAHGTGLASAATSPVSACPCSLLPTTLPTQSDSGDATAITVGLQFTAKIDGSITGLRYYRDAANTGIHTGTLYTAVGAVLATLTFPTADPGWQTASLSSPVRVTAGTTYVAGVFMPAGHFSDASAFFGSPVVNSPLTGIMGTYTYGSDTFPTSSFNSSNYYVDVIFSSQTVAGGPATVPAAPTGVSATAGNGSAVISWTAPANGGSAITSYVVTPFIGATAQTATTVTGAPPGTSATVAGLTNGTAYSFAVAAVNAVGTGTASAASTAVTPAAPATPPGAPTGVSATAGNGSASVSWTAPASDGGSAISSYVVTPFIGTVGQTATTVTGTPPGTNATITGLTNGTAYTFVVAAINAVGSGVASFVSAAVTPAAPATVPAAPTGVSATAGNASAAVTWTAPANGGSAITGYVVTPFVGGIAQTAATVTGAPPGTSATLTGLTNGTAYTFNVAAINAVGTGTASAASLAVTPAAQATPPGAPTGVSATAGNASATVTWTPPANGGSAITSYTVTPFVGAAAQTAKTITGTPPGTSTTITGLTNGTTYTFNVAAANAVGTGQVSTPSAAITLAATAPGAPTGVSATAGNGSATVSWTAPGNGGSGITRYTVTPFIGTTAQTAKIVTGAPPTTSTTITGLTNGTGYTFKVTATNAVGVGAASAATTTVTPGTVPAAPTAVSATAGNASATVRWTAPGNGGSVITTYTITPFVGATAQTATIVSGVPPAATAVVAGLTNGTAYKFKVTATNAVGVGAASAASTAVTPISVPGAPAVVSATAGNASVALTWTAPANNGSAITRYTVTPFIGATAQTARTVTGTPPITNSTISGLTNGTAYTFSVTATNAAGIGPASAPSSPVTPFIPTFVQQVAAHSGVAASVAATPTAAITTGNRLVVLVGVRNTTGPTAQSVTDSAGNSYVKVLQFKASDLTEMSVWTAPITAGGGTRPIITAQPSASAALGVQVLEYSGLSSVADATVVDTLKSTSGTTGTVAATVHSGATTATGSANELALGFYLDGGFGNTLTGGTGFTARANVSPTTDMEFLAEEQISGLGATPNAGVRTGPRSTWLMGTIVFKHR